MPIDLREVHSQHRSECNQIEFGVERQLRFQLLQDWPLPHGTARSGTSRLLVSVARSRVRTVGGCNSSSGLRRCDSPVSGTLLAIVAAIGALVGALLWLSQNLYVVRDARAMFVNFAANTTQSVVDAVFGMVNDVIGALEGLRQTANKLLPKNMEIKGKFKTVGESLGSDIAGDVRTTGRALGDAGISVAKDLGGSEGESGGFRKPQASASGGSSMTVHGDYIQGHQDNSRLLEVDNSDGDAARLERMVESALDRSAADRGTR